MQTSVTKNMANNEKRAFSLKEITRAYGLSLNSVRKEIESGKLPIRRVGKRILVLKEDLERWLQ